MNNVNDTKCSICLVSLKGVHSDITITRCNHLFCTTCILNSVKYKHTCPLCRTVLTNPPQKFDITFGRSQQIVKQELQYYSSYIKNMLSTLIATVEHHTKTDTLSAGIMIGLQKDLLETFDNFGMGICYNINTKFSDCFITNSLGDTQLELTNNDSLV